MTFSKRSVKRSRLIWSVAILVVCAALVTTCAVYVNDYYHADQDAIAAFAPADNIEVQVLGDNAVAYVPGTPRAGLIFYPGGKVEFTAYAPLMEACAAEGIVCVLVEMPFNLAVLDVNAAEGIQEQFPEVEAWCIGGHSLGGSMAASYLADHTDAFEGLILLGSYSTADLSGTSLEVLSVYGSEDQVMNREKYEEYKGNLPSDVTELVIEGGCHAYFGMYGAQEGDGIPSISNTEQILRTAQAIAELS